MSLLPPPPQQQQQQQQLQLIPVQQGIRSPRHQARKRASHRRWPLQDGIFPLKLFLSPFCATICMMNCFASILVPFSSSLTLTQADFGLSTSDADRTTTKARTGQLQVRVALLFARALRK